MPFLRPKFTMMLGRLQTIIGNLINQEQNDWIWLIVLLYRVRSFFKLWFHTENRLGNIQRFGLTSGIIVLHKLRNFQSVFQLIHDLFPSTRSHTATHISHNQTIYIMWYVIYWFHFVFSIFNQIILLRIYDHCLRLWSFLVRELFFSW